MSDKFKPYRNDRRPKRFREETNTEFSTRKEKSISKAERKRQHDNSWKRDYLHR